MTISQERINKLCEKANIPISTLEKKLGFSNGYINTDRVREFPADKLDAIAKALATTTDYLIGKTDNSHGRSPYIYEMVVDMPESLQNLIGMFIKLNDEGKAEVLKYVNTLVASGLYAEDTASKVG